jgi:hypothetical protein
MSFLHNILVDGHKIFKYTPEIFHSDFFNILKYIFYNRCICSYEPKHYVPLLLNILREWETSHGTGWHWSLLPSDVLEYILLILSCKKNWLRNSS